MLAGFASRYREQQVVRASSPAGLTSRFSGPVLKCRRLIWYRSGINHGDPASRSSARPLSSRSLGGMRVAHFLPRSDSRIRQWSLLLLLVAPPALSEAITPDFDFSALSESPIHWRVDDYNDATCHPLLGEVRSGHVLMELTIGANGEVHERSILSASPPGWFEARAHSLVPERFRPSRIDGEPVATEGFQILFEFVSPDPKCVRRPPAPRSMPPNKSLQRT